MASELNTTQIALLEAIKASLFEVKPNYPVDTDWAEVVKEAKAQTVLGIISPVIPVKDVSVVMGKAKYMRILYEQDKLIKLLDDNSIPCVVLKGCAASIYYPKPCLRAMGDVDLLVGREQFEKAMTVLAENGYVCEIDKNEYSGLKNQVRHIGYYKEGIEFELHHHFSSYGFDIDEILENAISKRVYHKLDGYSIPMLPDIENGLVLLGHMNYHLRADNLGLRQILDWELFYDKVLRNIELNSRFMSIAGKVGIKKLAVNVSKMCITYLGLETNNILEGYSEEASNILLNMIFENGNFGVKKTLTSKKNKNDSISFGMYNLKKIGCYRFFQILGLRKCKMFNRYPVLKPLACVYGLFFSIYKTVLNLVKMGDVKKQIIDGNERYERFEILGIEAGIDQRNNN